MMLFKTALALVCVIPIAYYWMNYVKKGPVYKSSKRLDEKTVLITGGNTGIGKATAVEFAKRGAKVIIASRNLTKSETAKRDIINDTGNKQVIAMRLDLGDFSSIQLFANEFNKFEENLHYLVNNAGVFKLRGMTDYGYNRMIALNHFGPFLLTNLLLDKMKKQSKSSPVRIINLSSIMYRFGALSFDMMHQDSDNIISDFKFYGQSKLATIYLTRELNKQLEGFDITTYSVHPGTIRSTLGENEGADFFYRILQFLVYTAFGREPFYGAQTVMYCALDDNVTQQSGGFFREMTSNELTSFATNDEIGARLWKESDAVTKKYLNKQQKI